MPAALTPRTLTDLVALRISEAEALLSAGLYDGACYLCGYVIELSLKAAVCRTLRLYDYPPLKLTGIFKTHKSDELLLLAGLDEAFKGRYSENDSFAQKWDTAARFGPDQRYNIGSSREDAEQALDAIKSQPDGVLAWLSQQW